MKKICVIFMLVIFSGGCSFLPDIPGFGPKKYERAPTNQAVLTKSQAIRLAKDFMVSEGFDEDFHIAKPVKIRKVVSVEFESRWVWEVYFSHVDRSFWKFWKRSPLMVEVDAESGAIRRWGRR